jgi:pimeloyl-ACP methyl ester carboxylesterase
MIVRRFLSSLALVALLGAAPSPETVGIVLMHGTSGVPLGTVGKGGRAIGAQLIGALRAAHYLVATPEMCWSHNRIYAKSYTDCFAEVDAAIADLKAHGARTIVVGGLSMGANAALGYAEAHPEIAGVIACAPAHDAARIASGKRIAQALAQAQDAVSSGRGDATADYPDSNQGVAFTVTATARAYVSYMDPNGPGSLAVNIGRLTVPMIWLAGTSDSTQNGPGIFRQAPANPLSAYVSIDSDHLSTCDIGTPNILSWLATLPG